MKILDEIKNMDHSKKLAMIIRHADRDRIPDGEFGNEILLNEKGVANSLAFGSKLASRKVCRIFTSPVSRCVQTAEYISTGFGSSLEIIPTKALGDPGLHVADDRLAGEFYLKHGFDGMYQRFMKGEVVPGVPGAESLRNRIDEFIQENTIEEGVTLFITHDSLIALYDFCVSGKVYSKESWVDYLSGIITPVE
jgi:broad specificity phosphatase PhoE